MTYLISHLSFIQRAATKNSSLWRAEYAVRGFYLFLLFIAFGRIEGLDYTLTHLSPTFSPRWPIFWVNGFSVEGALTALFLFFLASAFIGTYFVSFRSARIIAFLGMLQYHAFLSSLGQPYHQMDLWLWVALLLIFLPIKKKATPLSKEQKISFLTIIWGVQAFILLSYTLSGIGKLYGFVVQFTQGQAHIFSPDAAALHVATLLVSMAEHVPLATLVVQYPLLGWLPFMGIVFLEVASFAIAFIPSLQRVWGGALIAFHLGTYLTMRAIFIAPIPLLGLFFLSSPFLSRPKRQQIIPTSS